MYITEIPFLPSDVSIFKLIADGLIAFATVYGVFRLWPVFIKQKKIENLVANAKEASHEVTDTEQVLTKLFLITKKNITAHQVIPDDVQMDLHLEIFGHLNRLRNYLLLLTQNSTLHKREDIIVPIEVTIQKLDKVLNYHYKNSLNVFALGTLIEEINLLNKNELSFKQLEDVRKALLKIHDLE